MLRICITGHRQLSASRDVREDISAAFDYFLCQDQKIEALTSLATGADTIFAQEALKKKGVTVKVIIPFDVDEYRKDFTTEEWQEYLVITDSKPYETAFLLNEFTPDKKNWAYLETGKLLVNQSDIVLAVWDRQEAAGKGGTAEIVQYAIKQNRPLHIIKGLRPSTNLENSEDEGRSLFCELDKEANQLKSRFQLAWRSGIVLGLLAAICFAANLSLPFVKNNHHLTMWAAGSEAFFIIVSFSILSFYAKKYKDLFVAKRRSTEYLRTLLWFRDASIPLPDIDELESELDSRVTSMEVKIAGEASSFENIENAKRIVWTFAHDQVTYHKLRCKRLERYEKMLEGLCTSMKYIFFISLFSGLGMELFGKEFDWLNPLFLFLLLILPPSYAAAEGVKYFGDWKHNHAVSEKMIKALEKLQVGAIHVSTDIELFGIIRKLRNILEIENSDWFTIFLLKVIGGNI